MKKFFYSIAFVGIAFAFTACGERCTTCTYSYELAGQTVEVTQPEFCGSRSEVSDVKDAATQAAEDLAALSNGVDAKATCVDAN